MTTRIVSGLAVIAAAAIIGVTGTADAQPFQHGPRGGGAFVMGIAALKGQLSLDTSQQAMWDNAAAAAKSARESARANMQKVHDTMTAELAKAEPDLAAVAGVADMARSANATVHKQVRDAWLNLYGTFTPDQKAVVKIALQQQMSRMEKFREKMMQRHSQGG